MSSGARERFRNELLTWAETNLREFPWRDARSTVYEVFIAELFLTQTPAQNVASLYPGFLKKYPSLREIARTERPELEETIEPLGFQRMRAEALIEIAAEYERLPTDPEELQTLPRVGPYVANATICFAQAEPLPILDRNVERVYERVFGARFPDTLDERRGFAVEMLPNDGETARLYNLALLDFGALICTKREPNCPDCFAVEYCEYASS